MFSSAWSLSFALAGTVVAVGIIMMPFALLVVAGILRQRRSPASSLACFFLPIWRLALLNRSNLRDHRKIAVFDGERVFAGGRNLADEYMGRNRIPGGGRISRSCSPVQRRRITKKFSAMTGPSQAARC